MNKWQRMAEATADKRLGLEDALLARMRGVEPRGRASIYRDADLETLRVLGEVRLSATTTDWPQICADVFEKRLVDFYRASNPAHSLLSRTIEVRDFRPTTLLRPGELSELKQKGEGGEIAEGTIADSGEIIRLLTFAANFSVSSTVFANDDVGMLNQRVQIGADAVAFAEEKHFFATLLANPTLSDGVAFFHADHGNLLTSTAIDSSSVGVALAALRKQTAPGGAKLNLTPRFLLCGPDSEAAARKAVRELTPGAEPPLEVLPSAHIPGPGWYVFASPTVRPAFVVGRLRGESGPRVDVIRRFETDGVPFRVVTRFGVAPFDPRAAVRNPGA